MSAVTNHTGNEVALDNLATEIRTEHEAVRTAAETATQHAIQCGHLLSRAKEGLVHGEWLPWLQKHCLLSERTAQAYMRLARKHSKLDGPKAQRVADLPVREAMRAIADERTEAPLPTSSKDAAGPSVEEIWEWAGRQVSGPFNAFDLDSLSCQRDKLLNQTEVPAIAAICLQNCDDYDPLLRIVPWGEIADALKSLAPVAQGNMGSLDIDFADIDEHGNPGKQNNSAIFVTACLELQAQRMVGQLFEEMEYREKTYRAGDETAKWDAWQREAKQVADGWLADIDARRTKLLEEGRPDVMP